LQVFRHHFAELLRPPPVADRGARLKDSEEETDDEHRFEAVGKGGSKLEDANHREAASRERQPATEPVGRPKHESRGQKPVDALTFATCDCRRLPGYD
jgi:hypothetical protein